MNHPSPQLLAAFVRGEMNPDELLYVGDHLAACPTCCAVVEQTPQPPTLQEWRQVLSNPLEGGHLDDDQLIAYLRNQSSTAERAEYTTHLETCPLCAADLEDLRAFHERALAGAGRVFAPAARSHPLGKPQLQALLSLEMLRRWLIPAAAAGMVSGGLFWLGVRPLETRIHSLRHQLAVVQSERDGARRRQDELERRLAAAPQVETADRKALARALEAVHSREAALRQRMARLETRVTTAGQTRESTPTAGVRPRDPRVMKVLASGRLDLPKELVHLRGKAGRLLGGDASSPFRVTAPSGTVVLPTRPTFRWQPLAGATAYRVLVFDAAFNITAEATVQGNTEWRPEEPLARGKTYRWEVVALRGDEELERTPRPPQPAAQFRVLNAATTTKLGQVTDSGPLERGIRYASAGLVYEAEHELEIASETGSTPREREQARKLLDQLRALGEDDKE